VPGVDGVDWGDVATWVGGVAALIATGFAAWQAKRSRDDARASERHAQRSADAAEAQTKIQQQTLSAMQEQTHLQRLAAETATEQTAIQRQLRIDAAQPYVWADIRPDDAAKTLILLVVGNSGPTFAENIRITVDRPLPANEQMKERVRTAQARLEQGLRSLGPGRTLTWVLGPGFDVLKDPGQLQYAFTIEADGPMGPIPPRTHVVDLSELVGALDRPTGSLHMLTEAVKKLATR
jgi:hypothetical protein